LEKSPPQNQRIRQAAINILNYLRDHPQAKDTVEGIARWWVHEDAQVVRDALRLLQEEGVVEKKGQLYQLRQIDRKQTHRPGIEEILQRLKKRINVEE